MDPSQFPPSGDGCAEEFRARAAKGGGGEEAKAWVALSDAERHLDEEDLAKALVAAREALRVFQGGGQAAAGGVAEASRLVAKSLLGQGHLEEAYKIVQEGLALCRKAGDKPGLAKLLLTTADVKWPLGDTEEALRAASEAQALFRAEQGATAKRMQGIALITSCWAHMLADVDREGDAARAVADAKQAVAMFQEAGYKPGEAEAAHALAAAHAAAGTLGECLRCGDDALDLYLELKNQRMAAFEWLCLSRWHLQHKRPAEALAAAEDALDAIRALAVPSAEAVALMAIFRAHEALGTPRKAGRIVKAALARFEDTGERRAEAAVLAVLFHVHRASGKPRDALNAAERAVSIYKELGEGELEGRQLADIAALHLSTGEHWKALTTGEAALSVVKKCGGSGEKIELMGTLAEAHVAMKDWAAADDVANDMQQHFQDLDDNEGCAAALMLLCRVALAEERYEDAARAAGSAHTILHEEEDTRGQADALRLLCDIHSRREEHKAAIRAAEQARAHFQELGDREGEATVLYHLAQNAALLAIREGSRVNETTRASRTCREALSKATKTAAVAVAQARALEGDHRQLTACALCTLAQVELLNGRTESALKAADDGVLLFRGAGDVASEATALLLSADALRAATKYQEAQEAGDEALRMFKETADEGGQKRAEELLGYLQEHLRPARSAAAALSPVPGAAPGAAQPMQMVDFSRQGQAAEAPAQALSAARQDQARGPALDIALADEQAITAKILEIASRVADTEDGEIEGDTPLMEAGLTSSSAILLRDELVSELPGVNLPVTLVFDYPSISSMVELVMESLSK